MGKENKGRGERRKEGVRRGKEEREWDKGQGGES